jgi:hypothetical protein
MKEVFAYIADMAMQLADMCRKAAPNLALCLELASRLARAKII